MTRKIAAPALGLACLDLALKLWPGMREGTLIPGVLHIAFSRNTGVAFGMLGSAPWRVAALNTLLFCVVLFYIQNERPRGWQAAGFALITGGALGNLADRLLHGYVNDWLAFSFVRFPAFNLADACISVGAALLAITLLLPQKARAV